MPPLWRPHQKGRSARVKCSEDSSRESGGDTAFCLRVSGFTASGSLGVSGGL